MKICIDARCLMDGRRTGVEEYARDLLGSLFVIDQKNEYVLFLSSWKNPKEDFSWIKKFPNVTLKRFSFPNKLLNLFFWYFNWPKIDRLVGGAEVVFMPNIIFGSVSKKAKLVLTMHDLSFERYSEYFSLKRRWWHIFINPKRMCGRADKIIAVSVSTKSDLINIYKLNSEKIEVINSAISKDFRMIDRNDGKLLKIKGKYNLPYKFILFLGTIEPRKNIATLIKAFNQFQNYAIKNDSELEKFNLVIAGESGWKNEKIFQEIENSPFKEKIQFSGYVSHEDKPYFYNLASLFVYPSFFEGFGFPPLEAMVSGTPVITSNNSSLPEIAGSAAILIDPDKPEEIFWSMKEILKNREIKDVLIKKGLEKAAEFDWEKTAKKTLEILQNKV